MGLAASKQEAFWEACGFGHVNTVRKFLAEGIDVNWKSYTHDCCAIHVASQGKPEIVQMLLEAQCDVNVRDDRGNLALHHAAMKGEADIMKTLIKAGSDINAQDKNGWTSLHCAAYWAHPKAVRVLIDSGIDVHLQNKDQRTALHETCRSKENLDIELGEICRDLIQAGCDINTKSSDDLEGDFTPLMFAAYHGHPVAASALVDAGCELNARGTNLWTALHWATDRNNEEVVYILLEAGADPTCKGQRGELAAHRAHSNPDLKEMLLNAVNLHMELSSIGGANSLPGSQATSPVVEKNDVVTSLSSPIAETESLEVSEKVDVVQNTESSVCVESDKQDAGISVSVVSNSEDSVKNSNIELQVNSLSESVDQKLTVTKDSVSENNDSEESSSLSALSETGSSSTKEDNSDIATVTAKGSNENLEEKTTEGTRTVIGGGDAPITAANCQSEEVLQEKACASESCEDEENDMDDLLLGVEDKTNTG